MQARVLRNVLGVVALVQARAKAEPLMPSCKESQPASVVFVTGIPGSGKTTVVRQFIDEMEAAHAFRVHAEGVCDMLVSDDSNIVVIGKWHGYHADDEPCDTAACRHYMGGQRGDGTDRLVGPGSRPELTDELAANCSEVLQQLRAAGGAWRTVPK